MGSLVGRVSNFVAIMLHEQFFVVFMTQVERKALPVEESLLL